MNLIQLSQKETKDLEWNSTPIEQFILTQQKNKKLNNKLMILTS